jgi:LysR family carnitine catabolism transcriptional activator
MFILGRERIRVMERRHLQYFLAVAESGSFTRAAAVLDVAQPSLSHSIGVLEAELDSRLFDRLGRGVRLTAAGQALLEPARRTLRAFEQAQGAVRSVTDGRFGRLSVIANTLWAIDPMVRVIGEFRQLHPGVHVVVADPARRADVLERVRSGEFDFGLVDGTPPSGPLSSAWLVDHRLVAVLPPRVPVERRALSMADLAPYGLIGTPVGTSLRDLLDRCLQASGLPTEPAVETAHLASIVPLVLVGAGAALLPQGLAATAAAEGAQVRPTVEPVLVPVHLIWRSGGSTELQDRFREVAQGLVP